MFQAEKIINIRSLKALRVYQSSTSINHSEQKAHYIEKGVTQSFVFSTMFNRARELHFFSRLMHVVEKKYTDSEFCRSEAANALSMSERHLNRKLRIIAGNNFSEIVRKYRLCKAKERLLEGERVGEVAHEVGFTSSSYFCRCFREEFNCTPRQLLKL